MQEPVALRLLRLYSASVFNARFASLQDQRMDRVSNKKIDNPINRFRKMVQEPEGGY